MSLANEEAKTRIARRLRSQSVACGRRGSKLYEHLLRCAAEDLEAGGPTWAVLRGHENDPGASALALRFMGVVNRLSLDGREPELAACYREAGDPREAWREFRATLERNVDALRSLVDRPVQTNEVGRSAALLVGFLTVAVETALPLRLLEVGASAGLNLRWDRYRYLAEDFSWGPAKSPVAIEFELSGNINPCDVARVEVLERRGCDPEPLDPATSKGRLTLLSYIWPDHVARTERMHAALALAEEEPIKVEREGAAAWIADRLVDPTPGVASIVYHSFVTQYMGRRSAPPFSLSCSMRASARAPMRPLPGFGWSFAAI